MNGACRLAGMDQRRAMDERDGRLSVEEPQLPEPCSVYVPEYCNQLVHDDGYQLNAYL
jgi:hypothetical protein